MVEVFANPTTKRPVLLIISATIRRDLHRPFKLFKHFRVVHAYMDAAYGDMDDADFGPDTVRYRSPAELRKILADVQPDLVQAPEPAASRMMLRMCYEVWQWHRRTKRPYFFPMFENLPLRHKFGPVAGIVMEQILKRFAASASWVFYLNEGAHQSLIKLGFADGVIPDRKDDDSSDAQDRESRQPESSTLLRSIELRTSKLSVSASGSGSRMTKKKLYRANWGNWGIDRAEFWPTGHPPHGRIAAKDPATVRADHPVILFVGRLSAAKGVDTLLDAFESVRSELPEAELWLVGPSTLDTGNTEIIERARATTGVRLLGVKKQRELPELFRQAWVTVLLSRTTKRWAEQVGMVNLQSLACGTPIVTTDSGSISEYLLDMNPESRIRNLAKAKIQASGFKIQNTGSGALLVTENDPAGASAAILHILQDPKQRETMGRSGVDWVTNTFNVATTVPQLEQYLVDKLKANHDES